ncbi:MAG TPA: AraC family transcriptional regulator [Herbaspirillum sp.]|uniref:AraC family transcriptional regulator n=1 Tax=Herbaspirillum sp. TaxID=1890675 RepID=UPI002D6706BB|nr:AraC family transcriptional regulator [Herbaspirillum sp.]HZG18393.1 AraC family transcriptional regulator [Herbaspirillum sp.]
MGSSSATAAVRPRAALDPNYRRLSSEQERLVLDHIEAHLQDNLTVSTLAAMCHLSSSCFSRVFKASTGHTLCQWMLRRRLERARLLLTDPGRTVVEVAVAVGFHDQSHFLRQFKRICGMTVQEWRLRAARGAAA